MKYPSIIALAAGLACLTTPAVAQNAKPMSASDIRAGQLSTSWQNGDSTVVMGADGRVEYMFGQSQPTVICSPLRLCDLELQAGEEVLNVFAADSTRWKFDAARSGQGGSTPHILIKPTETNLESTLVITTNRRTYHIHLKSEAHRYMARIGFDYSAEPVDLITALRPDPLPVAAAPPPPEVRYVATLPNFKSTADLDFDYRIRGKAKWKPLRVFNDGEKTYIQMPDRVRTGNLPIFQVEGIEKNAALVNSRFKDGQYIVDQIFDRGMLVLGTGRDAEVVRIERLSE